MSYEKQYFSDKQIITASQLNHIEDGIVAASNSPDFLTNGYLVDPINQRGETSYTGANSYTVDRWYLTGNNTKAVLYNGYVRVETTVGSSYATLAQRVGNATQLAGKTLTLVAHVYSNVVPRIYAAVDNNGTLTTLGSVVSGTSAKTSTLISTFTVPASIADGKLVMLIQSQSTKVGDYVSIYWAALYEGTYTAANLPAYAPKPRSAELLECQRYFYAVPSDSYASYPTYTAGLQEARITVQTPVPMRIVPSITVETVSNARYYNTTKAYVASGLTVLGRSGNAVMLKFAPTVEMVTPCAGTTRFNTPVYLSADY